LLNFYVKLALFYIKNYAKVYYIKIQVII